ncbi:MAG: alkaline phosphatase family protein, partial [Fidelibacterota bacterium]
MKKFLKGLTLLLTILFLVTCSRPPKNPRLVVFLVLDQCRPDLITRYEPLYTGGLRWILDHGLNCTQTYHDHGYTATGPGHFTLASGQYPGPAGVLGNNWWDRESGKARYCVEDKQAKIIGGDGEGRSYRPFNTTALGDWLKASNPLSKVVSVAGKDRASVFLGGQKPDLSVWYNWDGNFVTSDYYADSMPAWLDAVNEKNHIETYRDSIWTKSLPDSLYTHYARVDFFPGEVDSYRKDPYSPVFPIGLDHNDDLKKNLTNIGGTPWLDQFTLEVAKAAVQSENLGQDEEPDILFLSLSGVDWMAHYFGPYSQEMMDSQIKLDRHLGVFIDWLDDTIGLENILLIQTSDHGGLPLPEYLSKIKHQNAGRIDASIRRIANQALEDNLFQKTGIKKLVVH